MELTTTSALIMGMVAGLVGACASTLLAILALCACGRLNQQQSTWNSPGELRTIHGAGLALGVPATFIATLCFINGLAAALAALTAAGFSVWALLYADDDLRKNFGAVSLDQLKQLRQRTVETWRNWRAGRSAPVETGLSAQTTQDSPINQHALGLIDALQRCFAESPGQSELEERIAASQREIQRKIDKLKEWALLSSEQRAERLTLVEAVQTATQRLTGAIADLRKKESDRTGIAYHVEGLKQYLIPAEVMTGLNGALTAVTELVSQQQSVVDGQLASIADARQALAAHRDQCTSGELSAQEALAMVNSALDVAQKALSAAAEAAK